jgi:4-hydroxy-tetrahydrodipicolinate synthase
LIEFQIKNGTKAIIPCGTTGEAPTLSHKEHERVIEIAVEQVKGRVPVIAGTGSNSTIEAIQLTAYAKKVGADGVLMISPYYNKPTQEGLYQHFKKVAEEVSIPIVLYNIPGRTAVNMEPSTIARLAEIDNIVGVKEASGSMKQITDIIQLCGDKLNVVSGEDFLTYPLMAVGGKGVISVVSNVAPRDMADLCDLCLAGKWDEARTLYYRLLPLCHAMFYETNPAPVKAALEMMGKISAELRLPLAPMSEINRTKLRKDLKEYGLLK